MTRLSLWMAVNEIKCAGPEFGVWKPSNVNPYKLMAIASLLYTIPVYETFHGNTLLLGNTVGKTCLHLSMGLGLLSLSQAPTLKKAPGLPGALGIYMQHKRPGRMEPALQTQAPPAPRTFLFKTVAIFTNQILPFSIILLINLGDSLKFYK